MASDSYFGFLYDNCIEFTYSRNHRKRTMHANYTHVEYIDEYISVNASCILICYSLKFVSKDPINN